jgi:hypothetical protein
MEIKRRLHTLGVFLLALLWSFTEEVIPSFWIYIFIM